MSYHFNETLTSKDWNPAAPPRAPLVAYPSGPKSLTRDLGPLGCSGDNEQDKKGVAPGVRRQFHRTKLCRHFLKGNCLYGDECSYAHTESDMQTRPDLSKTRLCQQFVTGYCRKGDSCDFAHGLNDLKFTPGVFKTVMCSWWQKGRCDLGSHCRFAHGENELQPVQSVASKPHSVPNVMRRPPGKNAPVPPSKQPKKPHEASGALPPIYKSPQTQLPAPASYFPPSSQMSAVAAAAAAAATAAVRSFDGTGSSRPHHAAVLAAATAAAHAAMSQADVGGMPPPGVGDIAPRAIPPTWLPSQGEGLVMGGLSYLPPSNPEKQEGNTSVTSVRSTWDPPPLLRAANEDQNQEIDESDADSVLAPLPKASDLKGSTGNLNMLKLANLGFSALQKRFASSPALTTILDNLTKPQEPLEELEDSDYGDDFPTQTITIEHATSAPEEDIEDRRRRAGSDPVAAGQQGATEELMRTLHTVQSESLLHELRHIWNETEMKRE